MSAEEKQVKPSARGAYWQREDSPLEPVDLEGCDLYEMYEAILSTCLSPVPIGPGDCDCYRFAQVLPDPEAEGLWGDLTVGPSPRRHTYRSRLAAWLPDHVCAGAMAFVCRQWLLDIPRHNDSSFVAQLVPGLYTVPIHVEHYAWPIPMFGTYMELRMVLRQRVEEPADHACGEKLVKILSGLRAWKSAVEQIRQGLGVLTLDRVRGEDPREADIRRAQRVLTQYGLPATVATARYALWGEGWPTSGVIVTTFCLSPNPSLTKNDRGGDYWMDHDTTVYQLSGSGAWLPRNRSFQERIYSTITVHSEWWNRQGLLGTATADLRQVNARRSSADE